IASHHICFLVILFQLTQLAASLYGYHSSFPQLVPQQPAFPLKRFYLWQQQMPGHQAARPPQQKAHQTPVPKNPNNRLQPKPQLTIKQLQPKIQQPQTRIPQPKPKIQLPPKQPQTPTNPSETHPHVPVQQPKEEMQTQLNKQAFSPQQQPWNFPQIFGHGGFQPQLFSPYQGTPYFGYGYQGMGGRPPYYSEEMFEQDFEEPKEKETTKESPATDPVTNSTVSDTNSTISNPASQGGNDTVSGLGVKVTRASSPGLQNILVSGNGASTPSPTSTQMSEGNGVAQNVLEQSSHRSRSPNGHIIQHFPSGSQHSTMQVSNIYKPHEHMGDTRHNIPISRGNPSIHAEDPTYPLNYGRNPNHRGNLQNTNSNYPSANTRLIPYGQQEQPHYLGRNPLGQRERMSFPSSDPVHQWNKEPVYRDNGPKNSPPESHSLDPQFKTLRKTDNAYNEREDIESFQPSGMHKSNTFSHQGVISATGRTPFEIETHQYDWKEQPFNHPDQQKEQFLSAQNPMWNNQEDSQVFHKAPPRHNSMYSSGPFNQRGLPTYLGKNSYSQSIIPGAWEDRENSPAISPSGQRDNPSYSPASPSHQMQRNTYYRRVQPEYEQHPRQDPWTREQHLLDRDNQYSNSPYNPINQHANPKYTIENPASEISNLPYEKINQWTQEEYPPVHNAGHLRQVENVPYQSNSMFGHRERKFQNVGPNSPQESITVQEEAQYAERSMWVPQRVDLSAQKETPPYFNIYSTDIRRNPTHAEDTGGIIHANTPISSENTPGRRHYLGRMGYSDDYQTERRMMTSYSTANQLCCADDSPVPRENKLKNAPQFRLASWGQKESSIYPEGSHAKYVRHAPSPVGIKSNQPLRNGKNEQEKLGAFRVENVDLEKSPPCSTSQLSQDSKQEANFQSGLFQLRNMPFHGSTIRGDRHDILAHLEGTSQSKRELERVPLKLFPEKFPQPQVIQSEALVSEDNRKEQHAALGAKRIPCFGSWLKQYLSSTGAPSGDQQPDPFYGENLFPTERPNSMSPDPEPISSTYPSYDRGEKPVKINSPGEEWAGQVAQSTPDCLLLQDK
ncbi:hypothetical protein JD844_009559, partial [Phrynosoma platyrhinos]